MTTKNRNIHFQLLFLRKNNDKKLLGAEHANKKEKKQTNIYKQSQENWSSLLL